MKYSLAALNQIQGKIETLLDKYTVEFVARDEEANKIEIGVVDHSADNLSAIRA